MATRVYKYGLRRPTLNADKVEEQLWLGHKLYNNLVEVERKRWQDYAAESSKHGDVQVFVDAVAAAKSVVDALVVTAKQDRGDSGSKSCKAETRIALSNARAELKRARVRLKQRRDLLKSDETWQLTQAGIAERAKAATPSCKAMTQAGLFWGTTLCITEAARQAAKTSKGPPRFKRWQREGQIGIQVQSTKPIADMFGSDNRVRIIGKPGDRKVVLALRIGSADREPVMAHFPMVMHRPLPEGARVTWVKVNRRMVGPRDVWTVAITVDCPDVEAEKRDGIVAVDIGWREVAGGERLRVASWWGSDGRHGEVECPAEVLSGLAKASDLASIRDRSFNEAVTALREWKKAAAVPQWFANATEYLHVMKSKSKLAALAKRWGRERFDGDAQAYESLEAWRYNDFHLWEWESSQRRKSCLRRKETYRVFAARLVREYGHVIVEDFDLSNVAKKKPVEKQTDKNTNDKADSNRVKAAPSELREALVNAFKREHGPRAVVKINPAYTSRTCHECRSVEDIGSAMVHTCSCGATWDRDENAAKNILRLGKEKSERVPTAEPEEKKASAWSRRRAMKRERPGDSQDAATARNDGKDSGVKALLAQSVVPKAAVVVVEKPVSGAARKPSSKCVQLQLF